MIQLDWRKRVMPQEPQGDVMTGSGTSPLLLSYTKQSYLKSFSIYGATTQAQTTHGKNECPTNFSDWESGDYNMTTGAKTASQSRIRLKNLIPVTPFTAYYLTSFHTATATESYRFIFRTYDSASVFLQSVGSLSNGSVYTTGANEYFIGVSLYDAIDGDATYEIWQQAFMNGTVKPFICLDSVTDKSFEAYIPNSPSPKYLSTISGVGDYDSVSVKYQIPIAVKNYMHKSEVAFNPDTWAEWTVGSAVTKSPDGLTIVAPNNDNVSMNTALKPSTKYGVLLYVIENTATAYLRVISGRITSNSFSITTVGSTGNAKTVFTTLATITENKFITDFNSLATGYIKIKDIRIFELPAGSEINTDFTNMPVNELANKYPYKPKSFYQKNDILLSCNTPLYAGDCYNSVSKQAMRDKYKLILTGNEVWNNYKSALWGPGRYGFYLSSSQNPIAGNDNAADVCTHLKYDYSVTSDAGFLVSCNQFKVHKNGTIYVSVNIAGVIDVTTWEAFLSAEYAAGHPVTFVYQRAVPDAETVAPPYIPTYASTTIIDCGTSLQPSNMEVQYYADTEL